MYGITVSINRPTRGVAALFILNVALIQELLQIRALYWLNTLFAVMFRNCFITMIYN